MVTRTVSGSIDVDRRDVGQHELEQQRRAGRVLAPVGVEVVLHDLGGERRPVVEDDVGPQRDRPLGELGVGGHRLGEERHELRRRRWGRSACRRSTGPPGCRRWRAGPRGGTSRWWSRPRRRRRPVRRTAEVRRRRRRRRPPTPASTRSRRWRRRRRAARRRAARARTGAAGQRVEAPSVPSDLWSYEGDSTGYVTTVTSRLPDGRCVVGHLSTRVERPGQASPTTSRRRSGGRAITARSPTITIGRSMRIGWAAMASYRPSASADLQPQLLVDGLARAHHLAGVVDAEEAGDAHDLVPGRRVVEVVDEVGVDPPLGEQVAGLPALRAAGVVEHGAGLVGHGGRP